MNFLLLLVLATFLSLTILGFIGLIFYKNNVKKISSLLISYSSFFAFIVILSSDFSNKFNSILIIMTSILTIFAANLYVLSGILSGVAKKK